MIVSELQTPQQHDESIFLQKKIRKRYTSRDPQWSFRPSVRQLVSDTFPQRLVWWKIFEHNNLRTTSKTPVGHRPVSRPFQLVAAELVEYEAYEKGFACCVLYSHDLSDSVFRQKANQLFTVTRAFAVCFRVFHYDQWS